MFLHFIIPNITQLITQYSILFISSDKELCRIITSPHLGLSDFIMSSLATPQNNLQLIKSSFSKKSNPNLPKDYKFNTFKNY